jgi:hypothetical protein
METGVPAVLDRVRQMVCSLHGHDSLLQFERDRMFLRCVSCGHETPGWSLSDTPPARTVARDARPLRVGSPQVDERQVA